jgi:uncharacterized protein
MSLFQTSRLLSNPHLQTLWSPLLRKTPVLVRQRERLYLADTDFVDLDWHTSNGTIDAPLVVLFHGLTGSSCSPYILGMQAAVSKLGWQSVVMNFRGCSGRPNRLPRAYHSGDTDDINYVLQRCRKQFPQRALFAIGYSLGGNALCKWLGEQGKTAVINAAVIVSAPYELARCATRLDQGFSRVYRRHLLGELVASIENKKALFKRLGQVDYLQQLQALGPLDSIKSFWQFDNRVIAPLHGFESADDYYQRSSARQYVPFIRTPSLLVHAVDDPFMPDDVTPTPGECPDCVELVITPKGGHVGFVLASELLNNGLPWKAGYWLEQHIPGWLQQQAMTQVS